MNLTSPYLLPVLLLAGSNIFMTLAWYGHLRFKATPLMLAVGASWAIALIEYCMAVPANTASRVYPTCARLFMRNSGKPELRVGHAAYSTAQLKTMQEVITLVVFAGFSVVYLKEPFTWNYAVGFALIALGAFFVFQKW